LKLMQGDVVANSMGIDEPALAALSSMLIQADERRRTGAAGDRERAVAWDRSGAVLSGQV